MNAESPRLRVLLVAFACHPLLGSEEGVGWGFVRALAADHTLTVLTADFHREAIEEWCADHPGALHDASFIFVPPKRSHYRPSRGWKWVENGPLKPLMNLAYMAWQNDAFRLARQLNQYTPFSVVHLLTYVGFRFPGRFCRLGPPFVWGPVGGLENTPWRMLSALGPYGGAFHAVRNLINSFQKRTLRGPRLAARAASRGMIGATSGNRHEILRHFRVSSTVLCEVGTPPHVADEICVREPGEPIRLAWSGQHLAGKALPLLLDALALLEASFAWHLTVLGSGPSTDAWVARAERLGLADRIDWVGWVPRQDALRRMQQAHAFVITSMMDLTSTVLLEALSLGLPVVCPDLFGFTDVVSDACGRRIPIRTPGAFIVELSATIRTLHDDEPSRQECARQALLRGRLYTWSEKARAVGRIYAEVVATRARLSRSGDRESNA